MGIWTLMRAEVASHSASWTVCRATLLHFFQEFTPEAAEPLAFSYNQVRQCFVALTSASAWPFLSEACIRHHPQLTDDISTWED